MRAFLPMVSSFYSLKESYTYNTVGLLQERVDCLQIVLSLEHRRYALLLQIDVEVRRDFRHREGRFMGVAAVALLLLDDRELE